MSGSAVVTGLGIVSPIGLGTADYWTAACRGERGIGPVTRFDATSYPARNAGEVRGFRAEEHLPARLLPQTDRMTQLALAASDWAFEDAAITPSDLPEFGIGVVTASSCGGFEFGQRELRNLWSKGSEHVSAYQSFAWFYAVNTGQISIRHGLRGPSSVVVSDEAGGLDAIAQARRGIRKGGRLMLAGGTDAPVCSWGWVAQLASGRMSGEDNPERAYLPFDPGASGYVPGEGGAMLVIEPAEAARERGARIYGEIAGYGATFDPRPGSGREPGLRRAVELALVDAGMTPDQVGVVFADAAAIPELDQAESKALRGIFGPRGVPVTAPKTMTGRLYAGAAPLDVAAALLALRDGVIPPTVGVSASPEHEIDLVTSARRTPLAAALVTARGYGGFNSAVVLRSCN
jgi:minimal PKS chain-length factor (CLF/KS beta)